MQQRTHGDDKKLTQRMQMAIWWRRMKLLRDRSELSRTL
jgi:hypothetical protein